MGKRLINVDEVEEIVPVLVGKLLENNLITEEQHPIFLGHAIVVCWKY